MRFSILTGACIIGKALGWQPDPILGMAIVIYGAWCFWADIQDFKWSKR